MRQPQNADLSSFLLKRFGGKVENFCDEQNTKHLDVVISGADDHPWHGQASVLACLACSAYAGPKDTG
jgi:hypothetical protein